MTRKTLILAAITLTTVFNTEAGEPAMNDDLSQKLSCRDLIDAGWKNMPDVADYVLAKPGANKSGYGSECHIGSERRQNGTSERVRTNLFALNGLDGRGSRI